LTDTDKYLSDVSTIFGSIPLNNDQLQQYSPITEPIGEGNLGDGVIGVGGGDISGEGKKRKRKSKKKRQSLQQSPLNPPHNVNISINPPVCDNVGYKIPIWSPLIDLSRFKSEEPTVDQFRSQTIPSHAQITAAAEAAALLEGSEVGQDGEHIGGKSADLIISQRSFSDHDRLSSPLLPTNHLNLATTPASNSNIHTGFGIQSPESVLEPILVRRTSSSSSLSSTCSVSSTSSSINQMKKDKGNITIGIPNISLTHSHLSRMFQLKSIKHYYQQKMANKTAQTAQTAQNAQNAQVNPKKRPFNGDTTIIGNHY